MSESFKYSNDKLEALLDGIFDGSITQYSIPEDLYFAIADYLKTGAYHGFGGTIADFVGKQFELLNELRENIYMFSAAKSYQQIKDIRSMMFDEEGNLVNQKTFNQLGSQAFEKWNESWGATEFATAKHQAMMAKQWNHIQETKDLLPYLRYSTIGKACEICSPLDGLTAPVDDKIWRKITPVNHFNCYCLLEQHEPDVKETPENEKEKVYEYAMSRMDDSFKMNSGIDRYVFSPEHPYFKVESKDIAFAKTNFGLPIPELDVAVRNNSKDIISDVVAGKERFKGCTTSLDVIDRLSELGYTDMSKTLDEWINRCNLYLKSETSEEYLRLRNTFEYMCDKDELFGKMYRGLTFESKEQMSEMADFFKENIGKDIDLGSMNKNPNSIFEKFPAFSCSKSESIASGYASSFDDGYGIMIEVAGEGNISVGIDMTKFKFEESEVLMPYSKKYRVVDVSNYRNSEGNMGKRIKLLQL